MPSRNSGSAMPGRRVSCVPHHPWERQTVQGAGSGGPRSDEASVAAPDQREAGEPEPGVYAGARGITAAAITTPPAAPGRAPASPAAPGRAPASPAAPGRAPASPAAPGRAPASPAAPGRAPASPAAPGRAPASPAAPGRAPASPAAPGRAPASPAAPGRAPASPAAPGRAPASPAAPGRAPASPARPAWRRLARLARRVLTGRPPGRHLALLACYTAAGIVVT